MVCQLKQHENRGGNLELWTLCLSLRLFRGHHHEGCFLWGHQGEQKESWIRSPARTSGLFYPLPVLLGKAGRHL